MTSWIGHHGFYAVFALMAVDALVPVGGELIMLYAGAVAAGAIAGQHPLLFGHVLHTGLESYVVLALGGTLGYLIGSLIGWAIGRWGGRSLLERHGRWLHLAPERVQRAERWFDRYGIWAVFLGRLTPLVRSFISITAGVFETPIVAFTLATLAGSAIWCLAFAAAGWTLGNSYDSVHHAFRYVDIIVVALVVSLIGLSWATRRGTRRRRRSRRARA
jgi:membrane protein DedA with SNARE-associated domain